MSKSVIAILCSDIHLSDKCPRARLAEDSWWEAMDNSLASIRKAQLFYEVPVIMAGDIFHRWNPSPRLINFAIKAFPRGEVYAIPGQHDLRYHKYEDIEHTGYWTLVEAGVIRSMAPGGPFQLADGWDMWAIPWGCDPPEMASKSQRNLAVAHEYIWKKGAGYPGAPESALAQSLVDKYSAYDVAVFGDNHIPFQYEKDGTLLYNNGAFIRRNQPDREYEPSYGLLLSDGTIKRVHFDDKALWSDPEPSALALESFSGIREFMDELREAEPDAVDFIKTVRRYVEAKTVQAATKQLLLEVIDGLD